MPSTFLDLKWSQRACASLLAAVYKIGPNWNRVSQRTIYLASAHIYPGIEYFTPNACRDMYEECMELTRRTYPSCRYVPESELLKKALRYWYILLEAEEDNLLAEWRRYRAINVKVRKYLTEEREDELSPEEVLWTRKECRALNLPPLLDMSLGLEPLPPNPEEDKANQERELFEKAILHQSRGMELKKELKAATGGMVIGVTYEQVEALISRNKEREEERIQQERKEEEKKKALAKHPVLDKPVIHWTELLPEEAARLGVSVPDWVNQNNTSGGPSELGAVGGAAAAGTGMDAGSDISGPVETGRGASATVEAVLEDPAKFLSPGSPASSVTSAGTGPLGPPAKTGGRRGRKRGRRGGASDAAAGQKKVSPGRPATMSGFTAMEVLANAAKESEQKEMSDEERKRWKKSVMTGLQSIHTHRHSHIFSHPVTEDIAPGYSEVVYRPMDLTTLKRRVETGEVCRTDQFLRDLLLMFTNAKMYNSSNHDIHRQADEMCSDVLEQLIPLWDRKYTQSTGPSLNLRGSTHQVDDGEWGHLTCKRDDDGGRTRKHSSSSETSVASGARKK